MVKAALSLYGDSFKRFSVRSSNVQMFVLNESTLLSLVELPRLDSNQYSDIKVSNSEVRIILRTISGKFSWDATALYGMSLPDDDFEDNHIVSYFIFLSQFLSRFKNYHLQFNPTLTFCHLLFTNNQLIFSIGFNSGLVICYSTILLF